MLIIMQTALIPGTVGYKTTEILYKNGKTFTKKRFPTRDHIVPCSKGGGLTFENVQALCHSCNSTKRDKLDHTKIVTWLAIPTG
jgi:5-methylcytosine-specific restriction endonuclease McrA